MELFCVLQNYPANAALFYKKWNDSAKMELFCNEWNYSVDKKRKEIIIQRQNFRGWQHAAGLRPLRANSDRELIL